MYKMYYLDFSSIHVTTTKEQRIEIRKQMTRIRRDGIMRAKLKHQHNQCFYCAGEIGMKDHLDHLLPVWHGGNNRMSNLVAACRDCNLTKLADQIEITNESTIRDYQKMIKAQEKYDRALSRADTWVKRNRLQRYQPKLVRIYSMHHGKYFREANVRYTK